MFHSAKILRKHLASPTVVVLELEVPSLESFLPGQWVDFVVPSLAWVGGFSIASSPRDLPRVTLAVKKSDHPPSTWVHEESEEGGKVEVRVGGTSVLEGPSADAADEPPRVFCAGGIGVSPILGQYREFVSYSPRPPARLLYSASTREELVFGEELAGLAAEARRPGDQAVFALTREGWEDAAFPAPVELATGRVLESFLDESPPESVFYLCGPPGMLDDAVAHLTNTRKVPPANIRYEKWW